MAERERGAEAFADASARSAVAEAVWDERAAFANERSRFHVWPRV